MLGLTRLAVSSDQSQPDASGWLFIRVGLLRGEHGGGVQSLAETASNAFRAANKSSAYWTASSAGK